MLYNREHDEAFSTPSPRRHAFQRPEARTGESGWIQPLDVDLEGDYHTQGRSGNGQCSVLRPEVIEQARKGAGFCIRRRRPHGLCSGLFSSSTTVGAGGIAVRVSN